MKKLPIGIQTFSKIREAGEDYLYIDKTEIALKLIEGGQYYFLSRPRHFGKSLFLDTMRNIFEGRKDLFKGLYIYDRYDWEKKYPLIRISFGTGVLKNREDLGERISEILEDNSKELRVEYNSQASKRKCFIDLIKNTAKRYRQKVVILVDEYDKPILDNITNPEVADDIREELKNFYSVIKDVDEFIRFVFLTGVSQFSKASLSGDLNNLEDITLDPRYATICGYTQTDLEREFSGYLSNCDLEEIRKWYSGYNWLGEKVYNPFDILLFFARGMRFHSYWFETATPAFLIDLFRQKKYFIPNLEKIEVTEDILSSLDTGQIDIATVLFQAGYVTILEQRKTGAKTVYHLSYPNLGVKFSLNDHILNYLTEQLAEKTRYQSKIYEMLLCCDLDGLREVLQTLFASISYNNFGKGKIHEYDGYYVSVIYSYFASMGVELTAEDITDKERIDLILKLRTEDKRVLRIYILEFRLVESNPTTNNILDQLRAKNYQQKYLTSPAALRQEIYLIGIEFAKKKRNLARYDWEKL